jgi:hypothetical protein
MSKGLRTTLWILSSLAVLWTFLAIVGWFTMMSSGAMMPRGMMGGMRGGVGDGMILHMVLTWILVLGLDGIFVYMVATSRRPRIAG